MIVFKQPNWLVITSLAQHYFLLDVYIIQEYVCITQCILGVKDLYVHESISFTKFITVYIVKVGVDFACCFSGSSFIFFGNGSWK